MVKKYSLLFLLMFLYTFQTNGFDIKSKNNTNLTINFLNQDKTILIRKIKAKIKALETRRNKLKSLKKWSPKNEQTHITKVEKLRNNLIKLGETLTVQLSVDDLIRKLQKHLKYLNNARVNKNAKKTWTKVDDSIYENKAGILIDSIIKLRMKKVR